MNSGRRSGDQGGFEEPDDRFDAFDEWSDLHDPLRHLATGADDDAHLERRSRRGKTRTRGKRGSRGGWGGYSD